MSCSRQSVRPAIPPELLAPIELPDRSEIKTARDMAQTLVLDEQAIRAKNIDLETLTLLLTPLVIGAGRFALRSRETAK